MSQDKIIAKIDLAPFTHTQNTSHFRGDKELGKASFLKLVQFEGDNSVYLIHFDSDGNEMTDTCHSTIDEAIDQAKHEYRISKEDWDFIN